MNYGAKSSLKNYDVKSAADRFMAFSSSFQQMKVLEVFSFTINMPSNLGSTFTANAGTDTLTSAAHGLNNGETISFSSSGTLPGGISDYSTGAYYYVINKTTNTFQISLTSGGSAVDITSAGTGTHDWYTEKSKYIITHNLGRLSPFIFIYNGIAASGGTSYFMGDSLQSLEFRIYDNTAEVYIPVGFDSQSPNTTLYFTAYQFINQFEEYTADILSTDITSFLEGVDYGIRISKPGFDVKTCNDVDCIITSSRFSNIIHKSGVDTTGTVAHDLGYIPSFFPYIKPSGESYLIGGADRMAVSTTTISSTLAGDSLYYIIFKNRSI